VCEWKKNGHYEVGAAFEDNRLVLAGGNIEGKLVLLMGFRNVSPTPPPRPQLPAPPAPQPAVQPPNRPAVPNPGDEFGIRIGMTEAELIAKLGPPDQTTDEPGKRSLRWFKGKRVIDATMIGGKATGMGFSWR
jgi:hypothetical protein